MFLFPYSNIHELNLDWLLQQMVELRKLTTDFININSIKYADPIQWNITTQYEANTVVINPSDSTAYLSVQPVPSGVNITNTEYWTPIGNFSALFSGIKTALAVPDAGYGTTTPAALGMNDLIWWNDSIYRALVAMPIGTALVIGTNVVETNISAELKRRDVDISTLRNDLTTEVDRSTAAEASLRSATNALSEGLSTANQAITTEQNARISKDNDLQEQIDEIAQGVAREDKYIIIGDSYLNETTHPNNILTYLRSYLGASNVLYSNGTSGNGFTKKNGGADDGNGFLDQLQSAPASLDKHAVTKIIVAGGMNDRHAVTNLTPEDIRGGVAAFCNYAASNYPNAKVYVFMVGVSRLRTIRLLMETVRQEYMSAARIKNGVYVSGGDIAGRNYKNFDNDNHPNSAGFECIAKSMMVGLKCGICRYVQSEVQSTYLSAASNPTQAGTISSGAHFDSLRFDSGVRLLNGGTITFTFNTPYSVSGNLNNVRFVLGKLDYNRYFGAPVNSMYQLANCRLKLGDDSYIMADYAFIHFEEDSTDGLIFRPLITKLNSGSWSIKEIQFYSGAWVFSPEEV